MKKLLLILFAALACSACTRNDSPAQNAPLANRVSQSGDQLLARAFENRQGNLQVEGQGTVSKILPDDRDGSRHQRFILKLDSGQNLLVAHNIDLAPRVAGLKAGDRIAFKGEYEWNARGGVIHWTHHDPAGRHVAGWIRHEGRTYQ
jgi:hypothetical protein